MVETTTLKPFQCAASLKLGTDKKFKFTNKEIAITCASHHGESDHINTVKSILKKLNLKASNLECGFHFPLNKETKSKLYSNQLKKSNIYIQTKHPTKNDQRINFTQRKSITV